MTAFSLESLRLPADSSTPAEKDSDKSTSESKARFIKGPISLRWISKAARLPGGALNVGLAIWYLHGLTKRRTNKLSYRLLGFLGLTRYSTYRALSALEEANLVLVERRQGQSPVVTLKNDSLNWDFDEEA